MLESRRHRHLEVFWELGVDLLSDGAGASLLLVTGHPNRHHVVCVHLVHRNGQLVTRLEMKEQVLLAF